MTAENVNDGAGTPKTDSLYAVFDHEEQAQQTIADLEQGGWQPEQLTNQADASALEGATTSQSLWGRLQRQVAHLAGGENHEGERYADHLKQGRTVIALQVADHDAATQVTQLIVKHGGYDVTYFRALAIEYMTTDENREHGVASHAAGNAIE